ncbi:ABC transporter ATP-binding protein [Clostridium cylindrosporum]|uniref:ABC-type nitrate/sulfonate/bicarbonate transport system, ATPase component n=1 Tax=Clostridium cylindrosporum DSM 605 TaxID=1121307 RepID=A0A0J8DA02_CLOCY|nr:ABC transporter ATP-binding protein [Clostridium cylindrosporum]KMT22885.1 ABC-type nitrate/sulfonate/bicarbonate transport system, ATPase component [Clostridium cylindrosporum DSM 605]
MVGNIKVKDVRKVFKGADGESVVALDNLNIEVKPGEFITLVGPSGCGKSTLLRLITGLDKPTSGTITLDDVEIKGAGHERGLVFQNPKLFPWNNIYDNVAFGLRARKVYEEKKNEVNEFINLVGLNGFEKAFPHHLSGGMAQRASLARALINHPKVLLLDEPLGALDALTRVNMQDEIIKIWNSRKTTMIMVTHDVEEAIYMSNRVVVMTPRPAKIDKIIEINLPYPRVRDSKEFLELRSEILDVINGY